MDLEQTAIERIRLASELSLRHYGQPLICKYSGGKDSDVVLELFRRSGVPFEVHHSHTTVDAPPTVYHIRDVFRALELAGIHCEIHYPALTMWELIAQKMIPPTRQRRYCCDVFKEHNTPHRFVATGVRWAESRSRSTRQEIEPKGRKLADKLLYMDDNDRKRLWVERCEIRSDMIVNPIIDWPNSAVWDYYWSECRWHNIVYKMGFCRVGCIGCPLAGKQRWLEFEMWPTYQRAYIRSFGTMIDRIHAAGKTCKWKNGYDCFLWWMEDANVEGQLSLFDMEG